MATELDSLCKWAKREAKAETVLTEPISYGESPLRHVTTARVGAMAKDYLTGITRAQAWKGNLAGWYTDKYWDHMLDESVRELTALRDAVLAQRGREEENGTR